MADLTHEQVQALEKIRSLLFTVSRNLTSLHGTLRGRLPDQYDCCSIPRQFTKGYRNELQVHANQASQILTELADELETNNDLLSKIVVVPAKDFPIHTQFAVAEHLLATGISLPVQEWLDSGEQYAKEAESNEILSDFDRRKLWYDSKNICLEAFRKQKWLADYTRAEVLDGVEKVETGLKRELVVPSLDDDSDEDFGESDEEEGGGDEDNKYGEAMDVDTANTDGGAKPSAGAAPSVPPMSLDVLKRFKSTAKDG
jgi:hypothetical protein